MNDQLLPIGSICSVKGNNKLMIISYYYMTYDKELKIFDYLGCPYPEGLLNPKELKAFMKNDIERVEFVGYKGNEFNQFIMQFQTNPKPTFKFDENGVVVVDPFVKSLTPKQVNLDAYKFDASDSRESDYLFDEDGMIVKDNTVNTPTSAKSKFEFDEDGMIIADNTTKDDTMTIGTQTSEKPKFEFDENGVIIADNTIKENNIVSDKANTSKPEFVFDNDGMIIADNTTNVSLFNNNQAQTRDNMPKFEFDENGVIIADNTTKRELEKQAKPPISEQNAQAITNNLYKFDENGIVIEDHSSDEKKDTVENKSSNNNSAFIFDKDGVILADNTVIA